MSDKKLTPEEKIEDIAEGQRLFIDRHLPKDPKLEIIRIAVEMYINEAESSKKKLLADVETEKHKNRTVKDLAEQLAREVLRFDPTNQMAEDALALLLENKMAHPPSGKKKR